jgi:hypothetical protein
LLLFQELTEVDILGNIDELRKSIDEIKNFQTKQR